MSYRNRMDQIIILGIALIFLGFFLVMAGTIVKGMNSKETGKVGVVGFIGPIPFGFGNDKSLVFTLLAAAFILFLAWYLFLSPGLR